MIWAVLGASDTGWCLKQMGVAVGVTQGSAGALGQFGFRANHPYSKDALGAMELQGGDAGERAGGFAVVLKLGAGCGDRAGRRENFELTEMAVNLAAGTDALDDLLAEVAALGEVQGAGKRSFLGEVAALDVDGVSGGAFEDAEGFEGRGADGSCARGFEVLKEREGLGCIEPEGEAWDERAVIAGYTDGMAIEGGFGEGEIGFRRRQAQRGKERWSFWTGQAESGRVRQRHELDVVHDDEAVEVGEQSFGLGGFELELEVVAVEPDESVSLDTALSVEDEVIGARVGGQGFDGIGDHAAEPAGSIFAADGDAALPSHVVNCHAFKNRSDFSFGCVQMLRR